MITIDASDIESYDIKISMALRESPFKYLSMMEEAATQLYQELNLDAPEDIPNF